MSIQHFNEIMDEPTLKFVGNPLVILIILAVTADDGSFMSTSLIAKAARLNVPVARKSLRLLERTGWIESLGPSLDGKHQLRWRLKERT
jgi:hypothetical protein